MTVRELINTLLSLNPEAQVFLWGEDEVPVELERVEEFEDGGVVLVAVDE